MVQLRVHTQTHMRFAITSRRSRRICLKGVIQGTGINASNTLTNGAKFGDQAHLDGQRRAIPARALDNGDIGTFETLLKLLLNPCE